MAAQFSDTEWFDMDPYVVPGTYSRQYLEFTMSHEYTLFTDYITNDVFVKAYFDKYVRRWERAFDSCMKDPYTDIEDCYDLFGVFEDTMMTVFDTIRPTGREEKSTLTARDVADILRLRKMSYHAIKEIDGAISAAKEHVYASNSKRIEEVIMPMYNLG